MASMIHSVDSSKNDPKYNISLCGRRIQLRNTSEIRAEVTCPKCLALMPEDKPARAYHHDGGKVTHKPTDRRFVENRERVPARTKYSRYVERKARAAAAAKAAERKAKKAGKAAKAA